MKSKTILGADGATKMRQITVGILYEFSQVAAYADNPFMGRQYQPVPMQYVGWFRHEIRSIYEQLRAAGVPVREMITEQQRVISW